MDDGGLSRQEHDEMRDLVLAGAQSIRPSATHLGQSVAAGVVLVLVGATAGAAVTWQVREGGPPAVLWGSPAPTAISNGWVAFSAESQAERSEIHLVKPGSPAQLVLRPVSYKASLECPSFSPDGARLAAGQAVGEFDSWGDVALVFTDLTPDGQPYGTTTVALDGLTQPPCPIWSADGRWVALIAGTQGQTDRRIGDEVWVVDTRTSDISRVKGLRATDIEWSPIAPELFIASDDISVYTTTTGQTRRVDGTSGSVAFTISPDGQSMVVQHDSNGSLDGPEGLWMMGVDGSDQRLLASDYEAFHGIGPVWSPDGNRLVYQRLCDTLMDGSGNERTCREEHEGVVVTIGGGDPLPPFGSETVIPPPVTTQGGVSKVWAPYSITWSPDGTMLLYTAWGTWESGGDWNSSIGVVALPVDGATPPVVLTEATDEAGGSAWAWARERG